MTDYSKLSTDQLKTRLRLAEDRASRADTNADYFADMRVAHEIDAVLVSRGVVVPEYEPSDARDDAIETQGFSF